MLNCLLCFCKHNIFIPTVTPGTTTGNSKCVLYGIVVLDVFCFLLPPLFMSFKVKTQMYACVLTVAILSSRPREVIECHQYHATDHLGPSPHTKWWHSCVWGSVPGRGRAGKWESCECHSHLCRADWPETRVHLHHLSEGLYSCRARGKEETDTSSSYYQRLLVEDKIICLVTLLYMIL